MKISHLANSELAVMELLWQQSEMTARAIREQLYPDAAKAQHGTVQRLLQRLEEKGCVQRDSALSVHLFSSNFSQQAYAANQLEALTSRLTGGSIAPLITHLMAEKKISSTEIKRLRKILDESDGEVK